MKNRLYSTILTSVFFLVLGALTLLSIVLPDKSYSEQEKRPLQTLPALTAESLLTREQEQKFTQKYEDYVADQFILRDRFVGVKNRAELLLGKRDLNGIYFGEDGYLFSKEERFNEELFTKNLTILDDFLRNAKNSGVQTAAVSFVPDSAHVYEGKLPSHAAVYGFDQVETLSIDRLQDSYFPLYETLKSHKNESVYYRNDHHWTTLGAYYAYQTLSEALDFDFHPLSYYEQIEVSNDFRGTYAAKINLDVLPDTITRFDPRVNTVKSVIIDGTSYDSLYYEDALETTDQYNYFLRGNYPITEITTSVENGKHLLVIKDSYAHSLIPFLCDHYEQITCIDLRHYRDSTLNYCEENGVTDLLVLYQATNFSKDSSILQLNLQD